MTLIPNGPAGRLNRKALAFASEIGQLYLRGYSCEAVRRALADAGLNPATMKQEELYDIGVIWASGNGGIGTFEEQLKEFYAGDGTPRFNPYFIPKMIVDIAAGAISIRHRLYGPNYCTVSACASSNTAIINAFDTIRLGKAAELRSAPTMLRRTLRACNGATNIIGCNRNTAERRGNSSTDSITVVLTNPNTF